MNKNSDPNVDANGDYILRWKLDIPKGRRRSNDPFRDFTQDLLRELLDIVVLTYKGEEVKVDGFHFLNDMKNHLLFKRKR